MDIQADDRLLRLPAVKQATGLSRSTIYRLMAKDAFPRPEFRAKEI